MIQTERLILRKFTLEDVEPSYQMNLDPRVSEFTGDGGVQSRDVVHKRIKNDVLGDYAKYGFGRLAVCLKSTGEFIGFAGLKYLDDMQEVDLGYRLAFDHWGKGLATEACKPLVEHGFKELNLNKIMALVIPENKASVRVLEKLGFEFEKIILTEGIEAAYYVLNRTDTQP